MLNADSMMSGMTDTLFVDVLSIRVNPDRCVCVYHFLKAQTVNF